MSGRLSSSAFEYYLSLGDNRSYQAVADHFDVSKRGVTKRATAEGWQERARALEAKARQATDEKLVDSIEAMNTRHLKCLKAIQAKALETLKSLPLDSAMNAVRALDIAIKQERVVRGEPADRTALSVEDAIRREYDRWMVSAEPEDNGDLSHVEQDTKHA